MFRRGSEARSKYFSAWPLGDLLCSGGDLNPHAFRHTPLKRTCLPFHHPSEQEERNLYHGRSSPQVFLRKSSLYLARKDRARLRWRNDRDLDPFSCPGMFQNFPKIFQGKFVGHNLVDLDLAAFQIGQRPRKGIDLGKGSFDGDFPAKYIERIEADGIFVRINTIDEQGRSAARELQRILTHGSRSRSFDDIVKASRT